MERNNKIKEGKIQGICETTGWFFEKNKNIGKPLTKVSK